MKLQGVSGLLNAGLGGSSIELAQDGVLINKKNANLGSGGLVDVAIGLAFATKGGMLMPYMSIQSVLINEGGVFSNPFIQVLMVGERPVSSVEAALNSPSCVVFKKGDLHRFFEFKREVETRAAAARSANSPRNNYVSSIPLASKSNDTKSEKMRESAAWKTLVEFDPDIQSAVQALSRFDHAAEERLAQAYLSVKDKSLLPNMISKITSDFEKLEEARAKRSADEVKVAEELTTAGIDPNHGYRSDAQARMVKQREQRSLFMIEDIKNANMLCAYNKKIVIEMTMYFGEQLDDHGYAKLIYADGTAELRSGQFYMSCKPNLI